MRLKKTGRAKNARDFRLAIWIFVLFLLMVMTELQLITLAPADVEEEFASSLPAALASFSTSFSIENRKSSIINNNHSYIPSEIESYFLAHGKELGLGSDRQTSHGCTAWRDPNSPIAAELRAFQIELMVYRDLLATYLKGKNEKNIKDLRKEIISRGDYSICDSLELHPDGLKGIFPSQSLSQTSQSLLEPIFPPMRDPAFCFDFSYVLSMNYLIHDFGAYCRELSPTSRIILFDIGASLDFHIGGSQPSVYLTNIYTKFGFHFDHIYAYEITPTDPGQAVDQVPDSLAAAYHWINVGVDPNPSSKRNPWRLLRQEYHEDDFVIVKLDIDTPKVEMALVQQLVSSPELINLVDVFYFEHHVMLHELANAWNYMMAGSVQSSLELFAGMRRKGLDAHFWV